MTTTQKALPVMIRYAGKGKATRAGTDLHDLLAVFPTESASSVHPYDMTCYAIVGQHSSCAPEYIRESTQPATKAQTEAMLKELRQIGYDNLRVVKRMTYAYQTERLRQAREHR